MTISMSNDPAFRPGFRPIVVVKNRKAHAQLMTLARDPNADRVEIATLKDQAYTWKTNAQGFIEMRDARGLTVLSHLRKDEWEQLDAAVIEAVRGQTSGVADLRAAGLTQQLGGLGTVVSQFSVAAQKHRPVVSMSGRSAEQRDRQEKVLRSVPVPIIHQEFEIGLRELLASRNAGDGLDVTEASASAREVVEEQDRILFNGSPGIVFSGETIWGYTTHPDRDTDTAANYSPGTGSWGTAGEPVATVLGMMQALADKFYYGPFGLYLAHEQWFQVQTWNANRAGSELTDLQALAGISFVRPSFLLAAGNVVLVQMTSNVVDLATAEALTTREWSSADEMAAYGKVMAAEIHRLKADASGNLGVAHATGAT